MFGLAAQRSFVVPLAVAVLHGAFLFASPTRAENWPGWRGPRGDGTSRETDVPVDWDLQSGRNVAWKVRLPGTGHSSPIAWEGDVFVTACDEDSHRRLLLCLDAQSGKEKWQTEIFTAPLETIHKFNSRASGTPATDGELVYTAFLKVDGSTVTAPNVSEPREITPGRIILTAVDFDGHIRWQSDVGEFVSAHGFCSCPVLYENLVIINGDHDGEGYLCAVDRETGKEVWRTPRKNGIRSYVTPIIRSVDGRDQLVLSGSGHIAGFDPRNGELLWHVDGPTEQFVASMVFDGERFFAAGGFPTHHVIALLPDGRGDVSDTHVAWHVDQYVRCYVPSPVLVGRRLYVADDRGTANCFDSADGTRIWQARLSGSFNASLVATDRLVYFLAGDGTMKVVKSGTEAEVVAESKLDEACHASPAISNGKLYLRGDEHLFCIGARGDSVGGD